MLIDSATSIVLMGFEPPYSASLDDVEQFLAKSESSGVHATEAMPSARRAETIAIVRSVSINIVQSPWQRSLHQVRLDAGADGAVVVDLEAQRGRRIKVGDVAQAVAAALLIVERWWFPTKS